MAQYTQRVQQEAHSGNHSFSANYSAAQSGATVISAPGSKKSTYLSDIIISNGDTAGNVRLVNTYGAYVIPPQNLAINGKSISNFSQVSSFCNYFIY